MIHFQPSRVEFGELSRRANAIPVYCSLLSDQLTPVSAFERLGATAEHAFLLESVIGGEKIARYSFLGADPVAVVEAKGNETIVRTTSRRNGGPTTSPPPRGIRETSPPPRSSAAEIRRGGGGLRGGGNAGVQSSSETAGNAPPSLERIFRDVDPLRVLEDELRRYRTVHSSALPRFLGGAVGYAGYDVIRHYEKLGTPPPDDRHLPDLLFGIYDQMIVFDHVRKLVHVVVHAHIGRDQVEDPPRRGSEGSRDQGIEGSRDQGIEGSRDQGAEESRDQATSPPPRSSAAEIRRGGGGLRGGGDVRAEASGSSQSTIDNRQSTLLDAAYNDACSRITAIIDRLSRPRADWVKPLVPYSPSMPIDYESSFTRERFETAVDKCKDYIRAGDIFQVVLSHRFTAITEAPPFDLYRALRVVNPSPFMFYVQSPQATLVGASPEILCRLEGRTVSTRPLAGTRPRGKTEAEDLGLETELLNDPKERAEHVMLVDLGRNDLGRVCEPGTVKIDDLMSIERYSHVMHICSNVSGTLAADKTAFDALRSVLPVGTVSGAPKVRAMQIIDEFEPVRRGPYAGAVGYVDFAGNMDTCIALRTLVITPSDEATKRRSDEGEGDRGVVATKEGAATGSKDRGIETSPPSRGGPRGGGDAGSQETSGRAGAWRADVQVGAGIVADSEPAREYQETVHKAQSMLSALHIANAWREEK